MRGKKIAEPVEEAIYALRQEHLSPAKAREKMKADTALMAEYPLPSERSFKRYFHSKGRKPKAQPAWGITQAPAEEIALVQPVLRAVLVASEGRASGFTKAEAAMVARVARAATGLRPWFVWRIAASYLLAEEQARPAAKAALDLLLAFRPWESPAMMQTFTDWTLAYRPKWWGLERRVISAEDAPRGYPVGVTPGAKPRGKSGPLLVGVIVRAAPGRRRPMNIAVILATEIEADLGWTPSLKNEAAPHKKEAQSEQTRER